MAATEWGRASMMERLEDEMDLKAYDEAMAEYRENPETYTQDEVKKILDVQI